MFDLNAPIVPGNSAAGVSVGQTVEGILAETPPQAVVDLYSCTRFEFGTVHLWVRNGKVSQVGVYAGYLGSLLQGIGIGSTIREIQSVLGPVVEDEEDNLIVEGSSGWCFETEEWLNGHQPDQNLDARVSEIYVFAAAA
jgi:hypothetical protein